MTGAMTIGGGATGGSHDEAAGLDATLEIMSDPQFYAEVLRNRRALDRGKGRLYSLEDLFGEEVPAGFT